MSMSVQFTYSRESNGQVKAPAVRISSSIKMTHERRSSYIKGSHMKRSHPVRAPPYGKNTLSLAASQIGQLTL